MSDPHDITDPENLIRHGASVRALASAILGDPIAAEDIAQETFLTALRGGTAPVRDAGAWLRGVARNLSRRWIRTESRRRHREEARPTPLAPASPDETAARLETETSLTDAVRALAEPYRTVVVLRYFDGLTTAETAARTGAPEATVKTRLRRGLAMLRDALDKRYGARRAWIPLLVRVTWPADPTAAATAAVGTATLAAGGVIMAKKILIVTVVAAVLAAVFVAPNLWNHSSAVPSPDGAPEEPSGYAGGPERSPDSTAAADRDSDRSRSPTLPADHFRVVVRHADGTPAGKALVRLENGNGQALGEARTDAEGTVALRATGERGVVHVLPKNAAPESREVEAIAGTDVEVTLSLGSVISGTLWFGEKPAAGVEVHLNSLDRSIPGLIVTTDARGAFRFTGLAPEARFSFFAGWDVYFLDPVGDANVHLVAPSTNIAIRAMRDPSIRGTVVRPDGAPVAGAVVRLGYTDEDGNGGSVRTVTGDDGRFEAPVGARGRIDSITLNVTGPDTAGRMAIEVDPARIRDDALDLGRIVLRPARTFTFLVRGAEGRPVKGAIVLTPDDYGGESGPTDESGRTEFKVSAETKTVLAAASGEGVAEVRLPDEPDGPIPVTLPGGTLLTVRIRSRSGRVPVHLELRVEADARLLDVPEGMSGRIYRPSGGSAPNSSYLTDEASELRFPVRMDGVVRIAGIRSGVPFRVRILDGVTNQAIEERDLKLGTRERRDVAVELSIEDRTLLLSVRDEAGRPVAGAFARVTIGESSMSGRTGASGIAVIPGVRGEKVRVTVRKSGLAPYGATLPVEDSEKPVPIVLRGGRSVRLTVSDAAGTPVACEDAEATATGLDYRFGAEELDEGVFLFKDLPKSEVRLAVRYAGAVQEVVVSESTKEARITVPETGSVIVRFEGTLTEPVIHRMRLTPTSGSAGTEVMVDVQYFPKRKRWEVRLPAVLPGRYRVALERWADSDEKGVDRYETARRGPVIKVAGGREIETVLPR
jgi:RNA polymerase sigma-70 factor (ECF subfamily)